MSSFLITRFLTKRSTVTLKAADITSISVRCYAARKGTRERRDREKKKNKKPVEEVKVGFIPHNMRKLELQLAARPKLKFDDSWRRDPLDDVYVARLFKSKAYPFSEAVQCHRETHHPDIYNQPSAPLHVRIELNMQGEKKTRFVENFTKIAAIPHKFNHGEERVILAFSKSNELQKAALEAGAQLAGGVDLIKQIQNGAVSLQNFDFFLAHPDILPELVVLRGLMKRKFPNPKIGTLNVDLGAATSMYMNGINYTAQRDEHEKDFGLIDTIIGSLDMENEHLEGNFSSLIQDVYSMRPKRDGDFISRCLLWSPPSGEKLKVGYEQYVSEIKKIENENEEEEEEVGERITL